MTPSRCAFKRCIDTVGSETMCILSKKARDQKLFYACDAANKGGHHHVVKNISWFDTKDNDFNYVVLDFDVCDGVDKDAAHALDYSFMKVDPMNGPKTIFYGQGTDAGGGGGKFRFKSTKLKTK